jgi:heme oxygenase
LDLPNRISSPESYRELLARFWGFYQPFERELEEWSGHEPWQTFGLGLEERRHKTEWLREDLRHLGLNGEEIAWLPVCEGGALPLPSAQARSEDALASPRAVGALYVIEGSTLGGQLVARELATRFGWDREEGLAFYRGYGAETGLRWREFCAFLERWDEGQDPSARAAAVQGAIDCFDRLGDWLCRTND